MDDRKLVPPGMPWLFFNHLPMETTDEDLQKFLAQCSLEIPIENIAMRTARRGGNMYALVAVPRSVLAMLVNWAIQEQKLNGTDVVAEAK